MKKPLDLGPHKKLKSAKEIEALFIRMPVGQCINRHFLQLRYATNLQASPGFKAGLVVSKRQFAKAVDRNLLKRRMREAIRLNQNILQPKEGIHFMVIYKTREILPYAEIERAIKFLFTSLNQRINAIL